MSTTEGVGDQAWGGGWEHGGGGQVPCVPLGHSQDAGFYSVVLGVPLENLNRIQR